MGGLLFEKTQFCNEKFEHKIYAQLSILYTAAARPPSAYI